MSLSQAETAPSKICSLWVQTHIALEHSMGVASAAADSSFSVHFVLLFEPCALCFRIFDCSCREAADPEPPLEANGVKRV